MTPSTLPLILIVEDERPIANLLADLLADEGYRPLVATSGAKALAQLAAVTPALITLDLNLPGLSGAELLPLIRKHPGCADIPIVLLSAARDIPEEVRRAVHTVLPKPFTLDAVLATIQGLIPPLARSQA